VSRSCGIVIDERKVKNDRHIEDFFKIPSLNPKAVRERLGWRPGQKVAFIDKGHGVLMIPVPDREALVGTARGANSDNYRDRNDRY